MDEVKQRVKEKLQSGMADVGRDAAAGTDTLADTALSGLEDESQPSAPVTARSMTAGQVIFYTIILYFIPLLCGIVVKHLYAECEITGSNFKQNIQLCDSTCIDWYKHMYCTLLCMCACAGCLLYATVEMVCKSRSINLHTKVSVLKTSIVSSTLQCM